MTSDTMKSGVVESDRNKHHESRQSFHRRKMTSSSTTTKTAPILNGSDEQVVNNNAATAAATTTTADYLLHHHHHHDHDHHQDSMMVRQQVNLAAAYHDHISCTKSSADLVCNKIVQETATSNRIMNLPCETDHIYANCGDKSSSKVHGIMMSAPSKEWDGEKRQLYDMCLLQLELLKRMEEQNTAKDKQIQTLKQENETLKVRQERMERRMCLLKRNVRSDHDSDGCLSDVGSIMSDSQLPSAAGSVTPTVPAVITTSSTTEPSNTERPPVNLVTRYLGRRSKTVPLRALKRRYLGPPKSFPCKRPAIKHLPSTTSVSSASESVEEEKPVIKDEISPTSVVSPSLSVQTPEAETTKITRKKSKRHKTIPIPEDFLTTDIEYYLPDYSRQDTLDSAHTIDGDETESTSLLKLRGDTDKKEDVRLSVPSWRYKPVSSFYQMEGTENIDDRVFHRRHLKCEQDEKRRKRWDIQRLREQRASEKLKYKKHTGSKNDEEQRKSMSLYPDPNQIEKIEVTERLPVTAFGVPIPLFQPSEFSLPWKVESDSTDTIAANSDGSKVT